jgi:hypothetical protein
MNQLTIMTDPIILIDLPNNEDYAFNPQRPRSSKKTLGGSNIRQVGEYDDSDGETTFTVLVSRELANSVLSAYRSTAECVFSDERGAYEGLFHPVSQQSKSGGAQRLLTLTLEIVRRIA